jgi:PhoH-like ATPase
MPDIVAEAHDALALTRMQVVLDTSALIADPDGIFEAYPATDLVVPLVALEELDGLKKRLDPVGRAARTVLRSIEQLRTSAGGDLTQPLPIAGEGTLRVALNGIDIGRLRDHGLDETKADNAIIGTALGLQGRAPAVTVVSADAAMRLKAATFGLAAADHVVAEVAVAPPRGWSEHEVGTAVIEAIYAGDAETASADIAGRFGADGFGVLKAGTQSVLVRRRGIRLEVVGNDHEAWGMRPRNKEQRFALSLLLDPSVPVVALDGPAGTGKTLCAVAAGLEQVVEQRRYARMCVYRPVVPVGKADLGYLPGSLDEKLDPWMAAIADAMYALTDDRSPEDARQVIDAIKDRGQLVMESVTHLRGRTLHNSFILVDEAQNLPADVIKTILTRIGDDSKIVFTGDTSQIDAAFLSEATCGLSVLVSSFSGRDLFGHIRLTRGERSRVAELAATIL